MLRLTRYPAVWLSALVAWCGLLWFLSSQPGSNKEFPIPHFDKGLHFTYFAIGGILCAGFLYWRGSAEASWKRLIVMTVAIMTLIGAVDEWHQSRTPRRNGNDPWDLLADFLGASSGAFAFKTAVARKRGISPRRAVS